VIGLKSDFLDVINTNWKQLMDKIKVLEEKVHELKSVSEQSMRSSIENRTQLESITRTIGNFEDKTYRNECDIKNLSMNKLEVSIFED